MTNKELYGKLEKLSIKVTERITRYSGHCRRRKDEVIYQLLLRDPMHRKGSCGRPARTYINQWMDDTQLDKEELPFAMDDHDGWNLLNSKYLVDPSIFCILVKY